MVFKDFGEISWDNIEDGILQKKITYFEMAGWGILILIFVVLGLLVSPFRGLLLTDAAMKNMFERKYEWLNRCDEACADTVNIAMLDQQQSCEALDRFYREDHDNYLLYWRLAIDDRATSIGCPGYPKDLEFIKRNIAKILETRKRTEADRLQKEKVRAQNEEAQKFPRYQKSLLDGGMMVYVHRVQQDRDDPNTMILTINDPWENAPYMRRLQVTQVMWQKWVNINSPTNLSTSFIRVINRDGKWIGGSPPGKSNPIWIYEDQEEEDK